MKKYTYPNMIMNFSQTDGKPYGVDLDFEAFEIEFTLTGEKQDPVIYGNGNEIRISREFMEEYDPCPSDYYCRVTDPKSSFNGKIWIHKSDFFENHIKSGFIKEIT